MSKRPTDWLDIQFLLYDMNRVLILHEIPSDRLFAGQMLDRSLVRDWSPSSREINRMKLIAQTFYSGPYWRGVTT